MRPLNLLFNFRSNNDELSNERHTKSSHGGYCQNKDQKVKYSDEDPEIQKIIKTIKQRNKNSINFNCFLVEQFYLDQ